MAKSFQNKSRKLRKTKKQVGSGGYISRAMDRRREAREREHEIFKMHWRNQ